MFIIDAHQDIAYNHFEFGRDFLRPALETRKLEPVFDKGRGYATLSLPDALRGRVGMAFGTLYVDPAWSPYAEKISYETPQEAHDHALRQLDHYYELEERDSRITIIRTHADLNQFQNNLRYDEENGGLNTFGVVILMEGADPIREPEEIVMWYNKGVRIVGPAWSETRYAGGTQRPGPFTDLGFALLKIMQELNILLDLSHLAEEAYYQAIETYAGSIIASHSNPKKYYNTDRSLSDEMIHLLAERDGVVGVVGYNHFIKQSWVKGHPKSDVSIEDYVNIIDYICQMLGNAQHVGIGTDWDGGFGAESIPAPFNTIADLQLLEEALKNRGYTQDDIECIFSKNFLRKLTEVMPTA